MTNQKNNPIFWSSISFIAGIGFGVWGLIRNDAIGNYKGAGFLEGLGIALIAVGFIGWLAFSNRKR